LCCIRAALGTQLPRECDIVLKPFTSFRRQAPYLGILEQRLTQFLVAINASASAVDGDTDHE
jgi:hypothetical protein